MLEEILKPTAPTIHPGLPGRDYHAPEVFELEKGMSIRNNVEAELADIERALHRLKEGSYGVCEACGRKIPQTRLEAKPSARFCVQDQARAEREARIA